MLYFCISVLVDANLVFKDDEEVAIPRASLNKYIKEILPDARLSIETRDLVLNCCHEFIHQLATHANAACARANKKTINPEHILSGMIGFPKTMVQFIRSRIDGSQ